MFQRPGISTKEGESACARAREREVGSDVSGSKTGGAGAEGEFFTIWPRFCFLCGSLEKIPEHCGKLALRQVCLLGWVVEVHPGSEANKQASKRADAVFSALLDGI